MGSRNRFHSFAPVRNHIGCKYYICGKDYFSDLVDEMLRAKEEIYIADWFLTPKLFLKVYNEIIFFAENFYCKTVFNIL